MTAFRKNECELRRTVEKSQKATTAQSAKPKAPVGLVTLFCDVSYCPTTKAAGWGAWYRTDAMEKGAFFGSVVPMPCENSNDGEFWGLVLALRGIFSRLGADRPDAIVLQCDNLSALSWIRSFTRTRTLLVITMALTAFRTHLRAIRARWRPRSP